MKKMFFFLFFLVFWFKIYSQNWVTPTLSDTINGKITCGVSISTYALFGGNFTGFVSDTGFVSSPICIKYSNTTRKFYRVVGFDSTSDIANGFLWINGSTLVIYGKFRRQLVAGGFSYYGALIFNSSRDTAFTDEKFRFSGTQASTAQIEAMGVDSSGNLLIYGNNLARLGGVNLFSAKVGKMTSAGVVTALTTLKPITVIPGDTATIHKISWDSIHHWIILGNFQKLGDSTVHDLATWNEVTLTTINADTSAKTYCADLAFAKDTTLIYIGWNGDTLFGSGIVSKGAFTLDSLENTDSLGSGFAIDTRHVLAIDSLIWFSGGIDTSATITGRVATWNPDSLIWVERDSGLINSEYQDSSRIVVYGLVELSGDTLIAFGNFSDTSSNFRYLAMWIPENTPPLAVKLINFRATAQADQIVLLTWQTASETNNAGFEIQRATGLPPLSWQMIGSVPGSGTASEEHSYSFLDNRPLPGVNYYRLRQTDFDGRSEYSKIVSVTFSGDIVVYPNPVGDELHLQGKGENFTAQIFDRTGLLLKETTTSTIMIKNLIPGIYFLRILDKNKKIIYTGQFVKQ